MAKSMVIVHGAGKPMSDFHVRPTDLLEAQLGARPAVFPVWYGDLANIGSPVFAGEPDPAAEDFEMALTAAIEDQLAATEPLAPPGGVSFDAIDTAALIADLVQDVKRYVFTDPPLQQAMRRRMRDALAQADAQADATIVVSHSLGTVLAFDVLSEDAAALNVSHFITLGSPLFKVVLFQARSNDVGQLAGPPIAGWWNVYDPRDPVANPLRMAFPRSPVEDVRIAAASNPIAAHEYWGRLNVQTMIAGLLRP